MCQMDVMEYTCKCVLAMCHMEYEFCVLWGYAPSKKKEKFELTVCETVRCKIWSDWLSEWENVWIIPGSSICWIVLFLMNFSELLNCWENFISVFNQFPCYCIMDRMCWINFADCHICVKMLKIGLKCQCTKMWPKNLWWRGYVPMGTSEVQTLWKFLCVFCKFIDLLSVLYSYVIDWNVIFLRPWFGIFFWKMENTMNSCVSLGAQ